MKTYVASSPKVEVNGETIHSVIDGMGAFKSTGIKILKDNGIDDLQPGRWYNQQSWLNAFKTIAEKVGNVTLFNIGLKIPENAKFPPDIKTVHQALTSIDFAYHSNHRGGEIGGYRYEMKDEHSGVMVCTNPYPDEFDKGVITAMCRKFISNITSINVTIDTAASSRSKGGDSTTFLITWK